MPFYPTLTALPSFTSLPYTGATAMEHTAQIVAALDFAVNSATMQGLKVVEFVWPGVKQEQDGYSDDDAAAAAGRIVPLIERKSSEFKWDIRCCSYYAAGSVVGLPLTKGDLISGYGPLLDDDGQKIGDAVLSGTVLDGGSLARVTVVGKTISGDVLSSRCILINMEDTQIITHEKKSLYLPFLQNKGGGGLEETAGRQSSSQASIFSTERILGLIAAWNDEICSPECPNSTISSSNNARGSLIATRMDEGTKMA